MLTADQLFCITSGQSSLMVLCSARGLRMQDMEENSIYVLTSGPRESTHLLGSFVLLYRCIV